MGMQTAPLEELEKTVGYTFHDKKLLAQSMQHSSYANEHTAEQMDDNERLEFLGDAVLEVISSDFLFHAYPEMPEGRLTRLRASIVCEPTLAMCARQIRIPDYMLLGKGEELTGGRLRDSLVSDAMEALIGAVYLDGGLTPARMLIERFILTDIEHKKLFYDSKTVLQEIVQRDLKGREICYVVTKEEGPDHAKHFEVNVTIGGELAGQGEGSTKKSAEQKAAYQAILALKKD